MALPTNYQRVGAAYDVTESGVASVYTAYFDGVDDCLVSPSIDFTGTDKMTVWAGGRKVSDAVEGKLMELSVSSSVNNGTFYLAAPNSPAADTYVYYSKGTVGVNAYLNAEVTPAPDDFIITGQSDISAPLAKYRRDGVDVNTNTGSQGTGNFGNYPLYVGQRGATSFPYKGFLSALCTRGAATDAALVTSMEKWLASKTPGAVLP